MAMMVPLVWYRILACMYYTPIPPVIPIAKPPPITMPISHNGLNLVA
jgi:hypothetical protein